MPGLAADRQTDGRHDRGRLLRLHFRRLRTRVRPLCFHHRQGPAAGDRADRGGIFLVTLLAVSFLSVVYRCKG